MIFNETPLPGVWRVSLDRKADERGYFARSFCVEEFREKNLAYMFEQSSLSHNQSAGTLRGMHYQNPPLAETKLVRCVRGSVFDVVVDLREGSPTRGRWYGETLTADNGVALYVPTGLAHGFQTLEDTSDVLYQITPAFVPGHGAGVRWDDPAFAVEWPLRQPILSSRDSAYPDWCP